MMKSESEKMIVAAITAVILFESEETVLKPSLTRSKGSPWSQDHRKAIIGEANLFRSRSKRSTLR